MVSVKVIFGIVILAATARVLIVLLAKDARATPFDDALLYFLIAAAVAFAGLLITGGQLMFPVN